MKIDGINTIKTLDISTAIADRINKAQTEFSFAETDCMHQNIAQEWQSCAGTNKCPNCGGQNIEVNVGLVLTSYPPQSQLRCKECGHYFSSGIFNTESSDATNKKWQHDQPVLDGPKVGDQPPSSESEPPSYPDAAIPSKNSPVGWICPKCSRCFAPHVRECFYCNTSEIKITY